MAEEVPVATSRLYIYYYNNPYYILEYGYRMLCCCNKLVSNIENYMQPFSTVC